MKGTKLVAFFIFILLALCLAIPVVGADSSTIDQSGTVWINGANYGIIEKFRTNDPSSGPASHMFVSVVRTQNTTVDDFQVLLLNQVNFDKYAAGLSYSSEQTWNSVVGVVIVLDHTFETGDVFYLVVDNKAHTQDLQVDYELILQNSEIVQIDQILWVIWIIILVIVVIMVVVVVVIVMMKKKTVPPGPPMPPRPPMQ